MDSHSQAWRIELDHGEQTSGRCADLVQEMRRVRANHYITLEEAAQRLGRSIPWVKSRLLEGALAAKLAGNRWLISAESLEKYEPATLPSESKAVIRNFLPERPSKKTGKSTKHRKRKKVADRGKPPRRAKSPATARGS